MLNDEKYVNRLHEKLSLVTEKRTCSAKVQLFSETYMSIELNYAGECRGPWTSCKTDFDASFTKRTYDLIKTNEF